MSDRRSKRTTGPGGRAAGPTRTSGRTRPARTPPRAAGPAPVVVAGPRPRSKLTGRAAVLVLVLAVLTVSYASSMRAYLQQRSHINALKTQIAQNSADIDALEKERKEWNDPAYVQTQARLRLGYVMPGEKTYIVLDENGKPVDAQAALDDPATVTRPTTPRAWWSDEWDSVELAGPPPKTSTASQPATKINGPRENSGG